ncbi:MAG: gamma-glutamyltransferase family protein [Verrucomicrobiia bacterium]
MNCKLIRAVFRIGLISAVMVANISDSLNAAERTQGRSMVVSKQGIVAAEHPLAAQAGAEVLAQGGSAVDAAVAANAVMGVVAPMMCGVGGDLFAIVYDARSGTLHGLNASGWAPAGLTIEFLRQCGHTNMPLSGIHSVTVPGAVDGWGKLVGCFGRKPLRQSLAAAIRYAEDGFPVSELVAEYWSSGERLLRGDTNATRTFLHGGHAPQLGEVFKNPDLAAAYRMIARRGPRVMYEGELARRVVDWSQRLGGTLTKDDLHAFEAEWVEPISVTYRGWTVHEIPPNGQGIAALMMLNLMECQPLADYGHLSARALHAMIESKKLAYADLLRYIADPRVNRVPVVGLLDKQYARMRAALIDPNRANCDVVPGVPPEAGNDTTYLCAVDSEGNMISLIQSNFYSFGSGLVPDGCGFVLQNRGGLFSFDRGHPNALAGRKRPLHTIIPGFMERGSLRIAFGIMGGWNQAQAHAQFVANVVDYGLNIQAALEAPRFTKMTFTGCDVQLESRVPGESVDQLRALGHEVKTVGAFAQAVGGGQAVLRDFARGVNYGASDPRKDGAAIPQPVLLKAR